MALVSSRKLLLRFKVELLSIFEVCLFRVWSDALLHCFPVGCSHFQYRLLHCVVALPKVTVAPSQIQTQTQTRKNRTNWPQEWHYLQQVLSRQVGALAPLVRTRNGRGRHRYPEQTAIKI